jgi:hypothetical protein
MNSVGPYRGEVRIANAHRKRHIGLRGFCDHNVRSRMDAHALAENLEKKRHDSALKIAPVGHAISAEIFEYLVGEALDAVHGIMLFKMRLGNDDDGQHVAAASVGEGGSQQFLILTLPVGGGRLSVQTAANSEIPIAGIAASYAVLAQAFAAT